jgi:hypothetical protein
MALSSFASLVSVGIGAAVAAYIDTAPRMGWRWIQWVHCMLVKPWIYTYTL